MKKSILIAISIFLLTFVLLSFIVEVHAIGLEQMGDPDKYKELKEGNNGQIVDIGNTIVWVVRTVGTSISVVMLSILGIKYILGSVAEKAEYKQTMWPYFLGAILIYASSSLPTIIYKIFQE